MLSHANLIADAAGTVPLVDNWCVGDRHISYLPLAHIYERNNMTVSNTINLLEFCSSGACTTSALRQ